MCSLRDELLSNEFSRPRIQHASIFESTITKKKCVSRILFASGHPHFYLDNVERYPYEQEAIILSVGPKEKMGYLGMGMPL
jgi:hypothetical protein